mmetsp:Transcript_14239/g.31558  ORF Transcript_14239/g.31558 Transcript_14239/m.31558 type:complete len:477 (-) Transcript_14239:179-1609(-)
MQEQRKRSISDVIESIGYGPAQIVTCFLVNGSWLADGCELLVLSSINTILATEWGLSPLQKGLLLSSVYVGVLLGNLLSGWVGDTMGRRKAVLMCFPLIAILSAASAWASGFWMLLPLRFFVGFGFGLGQPSAVAILMEISPTRHRPINQAFAQVAFAIGELYCCMVMWLDDPSMKHLNWRMLLLANTAPAILFWLLSSLYLKESPVFAAASGNLQEAHDTLHEMRRLNGKEDVNIDFERTSESSPQGRLSQLPAGRSVALCIVCFCYNLTIYGTFTAFPQLVPRLMHSETESAVLELAKGACLEIPGDLFGLLFALSLPRKWVLYLYFIGTATSSVLFASGTEQGLILGFYGNKLFPQMGSVSLFVLAAESFDTQIRATGTALALGVGRLGACLAPMVYEFTTNSFGTYQAFFHMSSILLILCLIFTAAFIPETAGKTWLRPTESTPLREDIKASHGTITDGSTTNDGNIWQPAC